VNKGEYIVGLHSYSFRKWRWCHICIRTAAAAAPWRQHIRMT